MNHHAHSGAHHDHRSGHTSVAEPQNPHLHHHGGSGGALVTSALATAHCLVGCAIGEFAGLAIGVTAGWSPWPTMALATVLAYVSGMTLGLVPVMRRQRVSFLEALRIIWIGEALSIGVMEVVMNTVDYHAGGMQAASIFEPVFWSAFAVALPAGFVAAWPVNWWLLRRNLKACH